METKTCKPVYDTNVFRIVELAEDYQKIEQIVVNMNGGQAILASFGDDIDLADYGLIDKVQDILVKQLDDIETQLNMFGYTTQEEPKEWKFHVNVLKELADEYDV